MGTRRRSRVVIGTTALLLALVSACGGSDPTPAGQGNGGTGDSEWDAVVNAGNEEGQVNVYHVAPPSQMQKLVDAFNERYPDIEVVVTRGAGELIPRVDAEVQNGTDGADIFLFSDPAWFSEHADALVPIDSPSSQDWPQDYWQVDGSSPLVSFPPFGMITWNTERFPDGFESFEDLLDPSLNGVIGTRSDMTPSFAGFLEFLETTYGPEYLTELGQLDPKFYPSVVPLIQAVASGEVGVANLGVPSVVKDLVDQGAPIDYVVPDPGYAIGWAAGVLEKSERGNAARVFMDFLMSSDGQQAFNGDGYAASALDVDGAVDISGLTMLESEKYTPEVLAQWQGKFDAAFG